MRGNQCFAPRSNVLRNFPPVFSIQAHSFDELCMFFWSPFAIDLPNFCFFRFLLFLFQSFALEFRCDYFLFFRQFDFLSKTEWCEFRLFHRGFLVCWWFWVFWVLYIRINGCFETLFRLLITVFFRFLGRAPFPQHILWLIYFLTLGKYSTKLLSLLRGHRNPLQIVQTLSCHLYLHRSTTFSHEQLEESHYQIISFLLIFLIEEYWFCDRPVCIHVVEIFWEVCFANLHFSVY